MQHFRPSQPSNASDRLALQDLFNKSIPALRGKYAIPAVPHPLLQHQFIQVHTQGSTGRLAAGALGRLPNVVTRGDNHRFHGYKIRELALLAVNPDFKRKKLGSQLIQMFEMNYRKQGVQIFFGTVEDNLNKEALAKFYSSEGFEITSKLPQFFELNWYDPKTPPNFYFYKQL